MKQLQTTIAKLKRDPLHAITVVDLDIGRKVEMNATGAYLTNKYGSVEGFFEKMNQDGILNFEVQDRRRNGSSFQLDGKYTVSAEEKNQAPAMTTEKVHKPEVIQQPNLFSGALMGGLNMMDVAHKTMDYSRLQQELSTYKEKFERLEKDNKKLEIENLKYELEGKKSAVNSETLNSFAPMIAQFLPMLLGKSGGSAPSASLGMPGENISDLKYRFIEMIKLSDDDMIQYFIQIANGISTKPEFDNELAELMTKHNLLQ